MIPIFINREEELRYLNKIHEEKGFSLTVIYGRRRIGKTELIKKHIENKKNAYILMTDESIDENIKEIKQKFYELTGKEYFQKIETKNIPELFKLLAEEAKKEKITIVIDELPYLISLNKGILSALQKTIDEHLKNTSIKLILCGSTLTIMENDVLGYRSPLYGRNTNTWKLQPFSFKTILSTSKNPREAIEKYATLGNTPYYLNFHNPEISIIENIKETMLTKGLRLYDEPLILLRQEFRESRTYRLILKYLAQGYNSIGKLCSSTGIDKSNLTKYLSTLEETGLIKHVIPLGMKRKGNYYITDPFFNFWLKYIYPDRGKLELGNQEQTTKKIQRNLNAHLGKMFEQIIEEMLSRQQVPELKKYSTTRNWWHKDKEIDIVALNEETKEILFAECKWQEGVDAQKTMQELYEKAGYVEWNKEDRKEEYALYAKTFTRKISSYKGKKTNCYDLKDIEKALR